MSASSGVAPFGGFSWFHEGQRSTKHPRNQRLAVWLDRAMVLVAVTVCVAIFLQASLIVNNKSSENVSMPSYILLVIASLIWMCLYLTWNRFGSGAY
jgi:protein-S-isoprenylcysteine O-methyltransferase Ste14